MPKVVQREPAEVVSEAAGPHPAPELLTVENKLLCPKAQAKEQANGADELGSLC